MSTLAMNGNYKVEIASRICCAAQYTSDSFRDALVPSFDLFASSTVRAAPCYPSSGTPVDI